MTLPKAVTANPSRLMGPYCASQDGCVKIPAPMIVPVTSAVAGHSVSPLVVVACGSGSVVCVMSLPPTA